MVYKDRERLRSCFVISPRGKGAPWAKQNCVEVVPLSNQASREWNTKPHREYPVQAKGTLSILPLHWHHLHLQSGFTLSYHTLPLLLHSPPSKYTQLHPVQLSCFQVCTPSGPTHSLPRTLFPYTSTYLQFSHTPTSTYSPDSSHQGMVWTHY